MRLRTTPRRVMELTPLYGLLIPGSALDAAAAAAALAIALTLETGSPRRGWRSLPTIVAIDCVAATAHFPEALGRAPPEPGGGAGGRTSATSALTSASVSVFPRGASRHVRAGSNSRASRRKPSPASGPLLPLPTSATRPRQRSFTSSTSPPFAFGGRCLAVPVTGAVLASC